MPKEVFYGLSAVQGSVPLPSESFEVTWGRGAGVYIDQVELEEDDLGRLIRVLKKAMRQAFGPTKVSLYLPGEGRIDLTEDQFDNLRENYEWNYGPAGVQGIRDFLKDNPDLTLVPGTGPKTDSQGYPMPL